MNKHHKPIPGALRRPAEQRPAPPAGASPVWNGIRRLWMVETDAGPAPVDPQPAPPIRLG